MRRRNHLARDLWKPEFRQKRVETVKEEQDWKEEIDEYYYSNVQEPGDDGRGDD